MYTRSKLFLIIYIQMNNKVIWILGAVVAVVVWTLVYTSTQDTSTTEITDKKITIATVTFPWYAPLNLAEEKELRPEGYDIEIVRIESLGDMKSALKAGQIDMYAGTYDMYLATEWTMPPGKAVLALNESTWWDGIATMWNIDSLEDLVGSTVTAEAGLPPHFLLMYALYRDGLSLDDIVLNDIPSADAGSAFIAWQADIVGTYEPYLSTAVAEREWSEVFLSTADTPWLVVDFLWASDELIEEKSGVEAVVAWWYSALDMIQSNPDESYEIMWKSFGVDAAEMKDFETWITWLWVDENKRLFDENNLTSAYANYTTVQEVLRLHWVNIVDSQAEDQMISDFIQ